MILDCHSHIASPLVLPPEWYGGWREKVLYDLSPRPSPEMASYMEGLFHALDSDQKGERLLAEMDKAGIDRTVLLIIDWWQTYPGLLGSLEESYQLHRQLAAKHPERFILFGGADPRSGKAGLDLFERSVKEWGFQGLKIYPPCGYSPADPRLFPYYEICEEMGIPVLSHIGPSAPSLRAKFALPIEIDEAAWQFPKVNFIMGHGAVTYPDECGLLASFRRNVYLDLSGFQTLSEEELEGLMHLHLKRGLHRQLLFGTDWPIHFFQGSQYHSVQKIRDLISRDILTSDQYAQIMYQNIQQLIPVLHGKASEQPVG